MQKDMIGRYECSILFTVFCFALLGLVFISHFSIFLFFPWFAVYFTLLGTSPLHMPWFVLV